jgi:hypothetical protein
MAKLEREGRLFGAGLLKNDKDNETTSDLGYGYFDHFTNGTVKVDRRSYLLDNG